MKEAMLYRAWNDFRLRFTIHYNGPLFSLIKSSLNRHGSLIGFYRRGWALRRHHFFIDIQLNGFNKNWTWISLFEAVISKCFGNKDISRGSGSEQTTFLRFLFLFFLLEFWVRGLNDNSLRWPCTNFLSANNRIDALGAESSTFLLFQTWCEHNIRNIWTV